jgi:hypothetical protein
MPEPFRVARIGTPFVERSVAGRFRVADLIDKLGIDIQDVR